MQLRFLSNLSPMWIVIGAATLAALAWWLYQRQLARAGGTQSIWLRSLPWLRGLAVFLITCSLAEPSLERRYRDGQPGRVTIVLDNSESMHLRDSEDEDTRIDRAFNALASPTTGLLPQLRDNFDVTLASGNALGPDISSNEISNNISTSNEEVRDIGGNLPLQQLWASSVTETHPLPPSIDALLRGERGEASADAGLAEAAELPSVSSSPLGDWLVAASAASSIPSSKSNAPAATASATDGKQQANEVLVLLSDGQSNGGTAISQAGERLASAGVPVFALGYGSTSPKQDVGIRSVTAPQQLYRTDMLQGKVLLNDYLGSAGYRVDILVGADIVAQLPVKQPQLGLREVEFSIPMEEVYDRHLASQPRGAEYSVLPVPFTAVVVDAVGDQIASNNTSPFSIDVAAGGTRVLLIDGRARWESRYLKNLFERDPFWQLDELIGHSDSQSGDNVSSKQVLLPETRLDQYNLILLGDAPAELFPQGKLRELVSYVERGGGLIFIDGSRQHLRSDAYQPLAPLLPIRWRDAASNQVAAATQRELARPRLTNVGSELEALKLPSASVTIADSATNVAADSLRSWQTLQPVHLLSRVEVTPGAEVLLEALVDSSPAPQPLLITKRYGAGRVLFMATDETWRWRYKAGDLIHQRLWNQLARWTMQVPLRIQTEFVDLDTGPSTMAAGSSIEVRCQLREPDGSPAVNRSPIVLVESGETVIKRQPLFPSPDVDGLYTAQMSPFVAGEYQLRIEADGFSRDVLNVTSNLLVQAADSAELLTTNQDAELLQQLTSKTGGRYFDETQVAELLEAIRPLSSGRVVTSVFVLWQSYLWFTLAIVLLVAEWIIRKRSGLV